MVPDTDTMTVDITHLTFFNSDLTTSICDLCSHSVAAIIVFCSWYILEFNSEIKSWWFSVSVLFWIKDRAGVNWKKKPYKCCTSFSSLCAITECASIFQNSSLNDIIYV